MHVQKEEMVILKHVLLKNQTGLGLLNFGVAAHSDTCWEETKASRESASGVKNFKGHSLQRLKGKNDKEPVTLDLVSVQG